MSTPIPPSEDRCPTSSFISFHQNILRLNPWGHEDDAEMSCKQAPPFKGQLISTDPKHPRPPIPAVPVIAETDETIELQTLTRRASQDQHIRWADQVDPSMAGFGSRCSAHSAFGKYQKLFIVVMVTLASFFSPLSGQIYYPVIPTLVNNYHLTTALVNLTVTTYMIFQGLAPGFMGTFADTGGRRPAYIIAFAIYTAANIGLALQNNFPALLVLRCIQSAGSSGTIAFGYGVIADIATPAERGKYIGPMSAGVMVAPALAPVIGGLLSRFLGWRSVFWFLTIVSGGYLLVYLVTMPETARAIVGNGRQPPKEWWRMSLVQYVAGRRRARMTPGEVNRGQSEQGPRSSKLKFPNPLASVAILLEKDALVIICFVGLVMFGNVALLTSTPNLFPRLYGFNELQVGLCFLSVSSHLVC